MIITWFTDPSKGSFTEGSTKFSSYYQFDTETKKFTRIRLELGRKASSSGGDDGRTGAFFKEERYVGFSNDPKVRSSQPTKWSVNDKGELCFDGDPLQTKPAKDLRTYDTSSTVFNEDTFIHKGNAITDSPNLPEGIETKHLSLIANDTTLEGESIKLTSRDVSSTDLSDALKNKVCEILDVDDFDSITDDDILEKLKSQIKEIKEKSIEPSKESIDSSLEDIDKLMSDIKEKIETDGIAPTEDFEKAYADLQEKVKAAKTATESGKGVKDAIKELETSRASLKESVSTLSADHQAGIDSLITDSNAAVETAQSASEEWERIASEYQSAEEATSIEKYEESIGNEEVEPVEL
ncbi:hypothetical protein M0D21_06210 [Aquimarina sp. D1M17]|uniref:hypothetical protein n=1 Tax=Aquimarina acroporae TaxID=2937283 RepID=UPI0020C006A6|nr:hypothetical protein [Aquimarina acroporae]MCK8521150.1 hypothetical protein [Aquimarina acroporae]